MTSRAALILWTLSAILGVLGVLVLFTLGVPVVALLIAVLLVAGRRRGTRNALKAGGALTGFGTATIVLLALANSRCKEFSQQPGQSCTAPDITVVTVAAAVVIVLGVALTFRARPRSVAMHYRRAR